ncbi:glycine--tRNA ligase [bacterium]|nr:glycine--tRNA ligase [bacterium]
MSNELDSFKEIISHCKEYGYVFPSSEIYDGLAAVYDYGPYGAELKKNIRDYWWQAMVLINDDVVGIDAAIFMNPKTWKASGHVDNFNDPMIDNKDSKKRYRADVLIEDYIEKYRQKIDKEVAKGIKRFGENFDEAQFRATNPNVLRTQQKIDEVESRFKEAINSGNLADVKQLIVDLEIACPESGSKNWTDVRQFNLMFSTQMGSVADDSGVIYLRPETAQGIFVNFLNVQKSARRKVPFGIAQTGKAFRNEIVARQFLFRMKEFEQMEMQFFVRPGTEMEWYEHWKQKRMNWHLSLGLNKDKYRFHNHVNLAHYANAAVDIEYNFPIGFKEVEGIHSRTDFDLKRHEQESGRKLRYFDPEINESYVPYVVETSIGLDRMFLLILSNAYTVEQLEQDGKTSERTVLKIPPVLAPVKLAILSLVKKDGLDEKAMQIFNDLRFDFACQYDEKDAIGRRYRRQDAIGTPYCITIDYDTITDNSVTVRYRDSMEQKRVKIDELRAEMQAELNVSKLLRNL